MNPSYLLPEKKHTYLLQSSYLVDEDKTQCGLLAFAPTHNCLLLEAGHRKGERGSDIDVFNIVEVTEIYRVYCEVRTEF